MKKSFPSFNGFTKKTFTFFAKLEKNNNTEWFNKNRDMYENELVEPSKSFVSTIAPFFNLLNQSIRTEPKFNQTLMRINKDMRFAKGAPYKNYFLIHFGKFKMDSEFYFYLDKNGASYGLFLNREGGDQLYFRDNFLNYRKEIETAAARYGVNGKFDLFTFEKSTTRLIRRKFDFSKHGDELNNLNYILLEKQLPKERKKLYSPNLITDVIKDYSILYPLYCFASDPSPLKALNVFSENMGIPR